METVEPSLHQKWSWHWQDVHPLDKAVADRSPDKQHLARFKTALAASLDERGFVGGERRSILSAADRFFSELPKRDYLLEASWRTLHGIEPVVSPMSTDGYTVACDNDDRIWIATAAPAWTSGWGSLCESEYGNGLFRWFGHLARQYILRSRHLLFAVAHCVTTQQTCNFIGSDSIRSQSWIEIDQSAPELLTAPGNFVWEGRSLLVPELQFQEVAGDSVPRRRYERVAHLVNDHVNSLDPDVHRAAYHLLRSIELQNQGFDQEATVALAAMISACEQFALPTGSILGEQGVLNLVADRDEDLARLKRIEKIRNELCAHPPIGAWWDFYEWYSEEFRGWWWTCLRLFWRLCGFEHSHRKVAPHPARWSIWLEQNATRVWRSTGHEGMP